MRIAFPLVVFLLILPIGDDYNVSFVRRLR